MNEKQLLEKVRDLLKDQGVASELDHSASGDDILRTPNELGLMLMIEVYDEKDGSHTTVPLHDLIETIESWREE